MNGFQEGTEAVEYYRRIMTPDDVMMIKSLWKKIYRIPSAARRCLQEHCRTLQELEDFFKDNSYSFHVENGRVALYDEDLETAGDLAEKYFKEKLEECEGPLHFMALKKKYLTVMDWREHAVDFIAELLREDEWLPIQDILDAILELQLQNLEQLREFLEDHEDHFFIENGRVALYDPDLESSSERAVTYFEQSLINDLQQYDGRPNYLNFKGHIGQADEDIIYFINNFYPGEEFRNFLEAHSDVFVIFADDSVSLLEYEAANYFRQCVENEEGIYFLNLRGHVGQAPGFIINYINEYYPEESFRNFLENNPDDFIVDDEGFVFLNQNEEN